MDKQVQDYISLKEISGRFKEVASSISDEEIKHIIVSELRNQIKEQVDFGSVVSDIVSEWLDETDNQEFVVNALKSNITEKFRDRR